MATKQDLIATAKELNELLGLEPPINVKAPESEIGEKIKEASELLEPEDKLSKVAKATLEELKKGTKKVASNKKVVAPVEDDEDEDTDDDEEEVEEDDDEEEEDEEPAPKKKKAAAPAPKKKAKVEEEEDEDDDEEDEDDDEEEPAPAKKKGAAPAGKKAAPFKGTKETLGTSRMIEVAKAMQAIKGSQTVDAIAAVADAKYVKAGGSVNIKQDKNIIKVLLPAAVQWGIVAVDKNGKLSNP